MTTLHAPVPFDTDSMTYRLTVSSIKTKCQRAIYNAERNYCDAALADLARAEIYRSQLPTPSDMADHYVEAAVGAIQLHCGIDPYNV